MATGRPTLVCTVPCGNTLGEGIVWDGRSNSAWWTDIQERTLYRSPYPFNGTEQYAAPERICSFGLLTDRSDEVVAAFEGGFGRYAPADGTVTWIDRPTMPPGSRFNDGRVDRQGTFWAGTMIEDPAAAGDARGALYRLGGGHTAQRMIEGVQISNGLCWSPDGAVMYFADTPRQVIWSFDVRDGRPADRRVFARTAGNAYPDGSTVDAEGCVWNAWWGAGRVVRYTPDGREDLVLEVPAPHVTCVAFGGPGLDQLLVTSARAELDDAALTDAPDSGALFVYDTPYRGLPESLCTLPVAAPVESRR